MVKLRHLLEDVKQLVPIWNDGVMQDRLLPSLFSIGFRGVKVFLLAAALALHQHRGLSPNCEQWNMLQDVVDAYDEDAAIHRQAAES